MKVYHESDVSAEREPILSLHLLAHFVYEEGNLKQKTNQRRFIYV